VSTYGVEVLVKVFNPKTGIEGEEWRPMKPAGARAVPYKWDSEHKADAARRLCYGSPEHAHKARTVKNED